MKNDKTNNKPGPMALTRKFLRVSRGYGVISLTYYYAHKFSSLRSTLPYLHFETGSTFARQDIPPSHAEVLERCHDFVIEFGKPIILSKFLPNFKAAEPELTDEIMGEANRMGVFDQYMVPVFGPYQINGVISFGFHNTIDPTQLEMLDAIESAAISHHNHLIRHFGNMRRDIDLSERENEVLTWIARGKTTSEIAIILDLSKSSIDTYTRRIFEKMGVHDRVSAAVSGVTQGLVKPA